MVATGGGRRLTPVMKPENMFWGDRYAQAKDSFGVIWAFVGPKRRAPTRSPANRSSGPIELRRAEQAYAFLNERSRIQKSWA